MNQFKCIVWAPDGSLLFGDVPPGDREKLNSVIENLEQNVRAVPNSSQDTPRVVLVFKNGEMFKVISDSSEMKVLMVDLDEVETGNQPVSKPAQSTDSNYVERIFRLHETGDLERRIRQKGSYESVEKFQQLVADLVRAVSHV